MAERIVEVCAGIEQHNDVWEVGSPGEWTFILGPMSICGRVMGLYDEEYGWPSPVNIDQKFAPSDLAPGHRSHPILMRGGRPVAIAIGKGEYEDILKKFPGQ